MGLLKSWTEAVQEVREQTGVRKVDFVDGVTPDIVEEKCPDCGKDPCVCKEEEVKEAGTGDFPVPKEKVDIKSAEHSQNLGKHIFVVVKRESKGAGKQDPFLMLVVDKNGKPVKSWGSHPSLEGAKKFGRKLDNFGMKEEVELEEHCGECEESIEEKKGSDYELYHKDFSSAMQHAYAHAKKKGFTVDPEEIDNKVATGPKKPSAGKTNRYILGTDKKKKVHIQVANLDNKKFELNMYIEETEKENMDINETIKQVMEGKVKKEDSDKSEPGTQGDDKEYAKKRDAVLKKYGVKACAECETEEEKKACFKDLDDAHVADHEEQVQKESENETKDTSYGVKKKAKEPQNESLLDKVRTMMKEKKKKGNPHY